jgi:amino acid adenylation domain-containing protein
MNIQEEVLHEQISYWKEELAGAPTKLELPTDKPRPAAQSFRVATETIELPEELLKQLKVISHQERATLFMTLGAGFMALLHRYTGQDDILVGTPVLGPTLAETEIPRNRFHNTVVLRSRFAEDLNFRTLLQQVRERALGAFAHSDLPFEQLVAELAPERDLSHAPVFQVMFVFHEAGEVSQVTKSNGNGSPKAGTSGYDLTLIITETENGLKGTVEYSTDIFEAHTIQRLCGHYETLLKAIARDPNESIAKLPMLTELERIQLLHEWNDTRAEYPQVCVHELFEQQASLHPDSIALVFEDRQLTYRELNERANQVAHFLQKRGVGPEVLVGVCLERCPEMLIALLGIWKAGGAYVPLDPAYPMDRLSFMVKDAAVKVLLTDNKHRQLFPSANDQTICLDSDWPAIAQDSTSNLKPAATLSNLAYIIYTSGSTGTPKGVMVLHGGLVNYLSWAVKTYAVEAGGSVPVHTSISFDLTVTGMYTPLLAGGRVEILSEDVAGQSLLKALRKGKDRSLVKITPAHLELLSQQISPEEAAGTTKVFVIGGENLVAESLQLWRKSAPAMRLINEYGPTETVVGCCTYEVKADDPASGSVPIGRPIANTQLYILDRYLNPVPIGVIGELYIGGDGVARGYLNRPELNKERFLADPFSGQPGARLYKTGDVARYRNDGILEYLGRVDNQVKVRGYRIELGEIEATLASDPRVKSCAVLVREDEPGNKQLVGYVVPREGRSPTAEDLRQFVKQKLPEYMAPAHFVFLDSIPLTTNGKVDRKALPAPSYEGVSAAREYVAPRTETEKALADIWAKLLKVERIGIHDDFFDLGGHSLMAMRAVSQIGEMYEVNLPLAVLLEAPTIAELAKKLHKEDANQNTEMEKDEEKGKDTHKTPSWSSLVPIRASGSKKPLFLVHGAEGNILLYREVTQHLGPDQPVYGLQSQGLNGDGRFLTTVKEMAAHYLKEILEAQPHGPYFLGGYCLGGTIAYEMAQQLTAMGEKVEVVFMLDTCNFGSVSESKVSWLEPLHFLQNLWFHAANIFSLGARDRKKFLRQKMDVESSRIGIRLHAAYHALKNLGSTGKRASYPHLIVGKVNHDAMHRYDPRPYNGRVAVIRPKGNFLGLTSRSLGWSEVVAGGGLEIHELPVYPKGILVEPFCRLLAEALKLCLQ